MADYFFFVRGFCFLMAHEMDAVRAKEWKIFPVLKELGDEAGCRVFTALHVPIYALLIWGLSADGGVNRELIVVLDVFFIVHVFLHLIFYNHPENRFRSVFSHVLIFGAGISAHLIYCLVFDTLASRKLDGSAETRRLGSCALSNS